MVVLLLLVELLQLQVVDLQAVAVLEELLLDPVQQRSAALALMQVVHLQCGQLVKLVVVVAEVTAM